jgi:hypothetical protein
MADSSHEQSDFVVCRACQKYFYVHEIVAHQSKEHVDHKWDHKDDPYRRFYYLTNSEVAWSLNRLQDVKTTVNHLRMLLL